MQTPVRFRAVLAVVCSVTLITIAILPLKLTRAGTPPRSQEPRLVFRTFAPFWQVNDGFSSSLIVRNLDEQTAVQATPILFTADRQELRLAKITIPPGSAEQYTIDELVRSAALTSSTGALALEFEQPHPPAIIGEVVVSNYQLGIIFDFPLQAGPVDGETRTLQASWWLPDKKTQGTVVLFNSSEENLVVHPTLTLNTRRQDSAGIGLQSHEVRTVDLHAFMGDNSGRDANAGLLALEYEGPSRALIPALLLSNEDTGFSLTGRFFSQSTAGPNEQNETDWYFPSVFTGAPPEELGFSKGTKLTPYVLLSNTTGSLLPVTLEAGYEPLEGGVSVSATLPIAPLAPFETRLLDLSDSQVRKLIAKDVTSLNLKLHHPGAAGDVAMRVFSVDKRQDFVFTSEGTQHPARNARPVYWSIAGDLSALLTLQNVTGSDLQARVTLSYNHGSGQYYPPLFTIPAHASRT